MKARKLEGGAKSVQANPQSYERTSRIRYEDKKSGSYERYTAKEKVSCGERHVERGNRQVGVRNEYKTSSTTKVGNKRCYTEYYREDRVRDVDFSKNYGSNNNFLKNDNSSAYNDYDSDDKDSDDYNSDGNDFYDKDSDDNNFVDNDSDGNDPDDNDSDGYYSDSDDY